MVGISIFSHAYWNYLVKTSERKHIFVALSKISEVLIFGIPAVYFLTITRFETGFEPGFEPGVWFLIAVAAFITFLNYFFLSSAYEHGDLSLMYPISRSGTLFLPLIAFLLIDEVIDPTGWMAVLLIMAGTIIMHLDSFSRSSFREILINLNNKGTVYALFAALGLAVYTVWGKLSLQTLHPFFFFYWYTFLTTIGYAVFSFYRTPRSEIKAEWKQNRSRILQVGFFNGFTYLLVLLSLTMAKATYVGGFRQLSIVVGVFFGYKFLNESISVPKLAGIVISLLGGALIYLAK